MKLYIKESPDVTGSKNRGHRRSINEAKAPDLLNMDEQKVVDIFIQTMKDYVDEFRRNVRGIDVSYDLFPDYFYIRYYALRPTYTRQDTKKAAAIFDKYATILTMYLDILKFQYKDIEYYEDKTEVSSARIGKDLLVYNFPFTLPWR